MGVHMKKIELFKKELDKISPTFCIAKWKQVTMHLESGLTHSCHHPAPHMVPLDELEENPSALHNTKYKKSMRRQMLNGERVPECAYCNRVEQGTSSDFSDRIYKSNNIWAKKYVDEIISNGWEYDVFPSYFEVSFSSACNCSCIYCSPTYSTGWVKEIDEHGGYPTSISTRGFDESPPPEYMHKEYNPYIDAFWKWWPDLYRTLDFFRITGGEPLLNKDTFKILDYVIENPRPESHLDINSNFCVPPKIFDKFIDKYKRISKNFNRLGVFTSCEAKGEKAEYIRPGLHYDTWMKNCRTYLNEVPNGRLRFMSTYNILSVSSFKEFLIDVLKLKQEFKMRVMIDIPILTTPSYLQANLITDDFLNYISDSVFFMCQNLDIPEWPPLAGTAFWDFETSKLIRIYNLVKDKIENEKVLRERKDFAIFVDEHDRRYGTDFLKVFPEYKEFYYKCKGE